MRQGVTIILRREDGAILLQHRDADPSITNPDCWALLTGAVEPGEAVTDAAIRELKEETTYSVKSNDLHYIGRKPQLIGDEIVDRTIYLIFYDRRQLICRQEGQAMIFAQPSAFPIMNILPEHLDFITQAETMLQGAQRERRG